MTEYPKSLAIAKRIYEEAHIERDFVVTPNKIYFRVVTNPAVLNPFDVEFIVADHMFDSSYLESEVTAYLIASDQELAAWNRKFHLRYIEDEMKFFIIDEKMFSADDSRTFSWLMKAKSPEKVEAHYILIHNVENYYKEDGETLGYGTNCGNQFAIESIREICFDDFNILSKHVPVIS